MAKSDCSHCRQPQLGIAPPTGQGLGDPASGHLDQLRVDLATGEPATLPRKVRDEVYEPYHQELLEDYLLTRKKYRTRLARRWLTFAFTVRTALVVIQCLYVMLGEKGRKVLRWVVLTLLGEEAVRAFREVFFT
jgi:hypothetical protein